MIRLRFDLQDQMMEYLTDFEQFKKSYKKVKINVINIFFNWYIFLNVLCESPPELTKESRGTSRLV